MKRCYLIAVLLVLFAAGAQAQVYWQSDFGPWGGRVNDLFEDAGGTLYAATMQGVSVSTDEGRSWNLFALDGEATSDIHRSTKGTFLVVRERQLLRSTDGGTQWEVCHTFNIGVTGVEGERFSGFFEHSSGALFHRRSATCYVSTDDGVHWERFDAPRSQAVACTHGRTGPNSDTYHSMRAVGRFPTT